MYIWSLGFLLNPSKITPIESVFRYRNETTSKCITYFVSCNFVYRQVSDIDFIAADKAAFNEIVAADMAASDIVVDQVEPEDYGEEI